MKGKKITIIASVLLFIAILIFLFIPFLEISYTKSINFVQREKVQTQISGFKFLFSGGINSADYFGIFNLFFIVIIISCITLAIINIINNSKRIFKIVLLISELAFTISSLFIFNYMANRIFGDDIIMIQVTHSYTVTYYIYLSLTIISICILLIDYLKELFKLTHQ